MSNSGGTRRALRRTAKGRFGAAVAALGLSAGIVAVATPAAQATPHRPASAKLQKVTLTLALVPPKMIFMGFYVAQAEGFFKKNGLDVTLMPEQGGVQAARAVAAGDAVFEAGGTDAIGASVAHNGGLISIWSYGGDDLSLIANKSIKSVAGLRGQTIGLGDATGPAFELTSIALRNAGVSMSAVHDVILNGRPALVGALAANSIQASAFHVDDGYTVLAKDPNAHVLEPLYKAAPLYWYGAVGIPVKYGKSHPGNVVAFLKSMVEAQQWMYTHRSQVIALSIKDTGELPSVVAKAYDFLTHNHLWTTGVGMNDKQVSWTMKQFRLNGIVSHIPPVSKVFDPTFID